MQMEQSLGLNNMISRITVRLAFRANSRLQGLLLTSHHRCSCMGAITPIISEANSGHSGVTLC